MNNFLKIALFISIFIFLIGSVHIARAQCVGKNPTVSVDPLSNTGFLGQTLTYTVSVKNEDLSCGVSSFSLTNDCLPEWTCSFTNNSLDISSGSTKSTTLSVKPSFTATDSVIAVTATNTLSPAYFGSMWIWYLIKEPYCAMKTRASGPLNGYFYTPILPQKSLKVVLLFDNPDLEGDQTGASGEYYRMPDRVVDVSDQTFIIDKIPTSEGGANWDYMADIYPDKVIDGSEQVIVVSNDGKSGTYINVTDVLAEVTVLFNVGGELSLDSQGRCNIPAGAASFTVKKSGNPIGAYVLFYSTPVPPTEICNNGIDDDGDTFIDCFDSDCAGDPNCDTCLRDLEVSISPSLQSGSAGDTLTYDLEVTNKSTVACGDSNFNLSVVPCTAGWACAFADNPLTISPGGAKKSTTLSVTSSTTAIADDYAEDILVEDSADPTVKWLESVTYVVVPPCGNGALDLGEQCDIGLDGIPGNGDDIDDACDGLCQDDCSCLSLGMGCVNPVYFDGNCAFISYPDPWACGILFSGDLCDGCNGGHNCLCAGSFVKDSCNSGNFTCDTGRCPNESGYEGSMCLLADPNTAPYIGNYCFFPKEGRWDPNERMCVTCDGQPYQVTKVADAVGQRCYACTAENTWTEMGCETDITQTCEAACGASPQCDEKMPGDSCGVGISCDANCQCPLCGNDVLDPGEQCDPPGAAVCPGGNVCQADCKCPGPAADCEKNCTCFCPFECSCSSGGECRGGLVPCGRSCDDPCTKNCECCPCTLCHFFVLFKRIVDFLTIDILFPLAVLMIVISGIMFLTAAGDPGRIGNAKKILTATVIGILIILIAWLIVDTIIMFITPAGSPFQNWSTINCPVCGDGTCDPGENATNCLADCP